MTVVVRPIRPAVAANGPFSGKPRIATAVPCSASAMRSAGTPSGSDERSTATSFRASNATACVRNRSPPTSTVVLSWPATTCAAVTTSRGPATQPLPDTERPQATPSTRTTLGAAARTPGRRSSAGSGGSAGASGPAIAGNGSTRWIASISRPGGTNAFRRCSTIDCCASRRSSVWPGRCSATAPATHTTASPAAAPTASPPSESSARSGGSSRSERRAALPAIVATVSSTSAPTAAPPSATSGVYGESSPPSSCGARRAPSTAPTAIPTSESALPTSPFRSPRNAASATKPSAIQSVLVTNAT